MRRRIEPELMSDPEQALAYARADFDEPNSQFCAHLQARFANLPARALVVDLGCGPADIPIRLARRFPGWLFDALDGSPAMIDLARAKVSEAGLQERIRLVCCTLQGAVPRSSYDLLLSNSLLHHLPDPRLLWERLRVFGHRGTHVLIMDLMRPESEAVAQAIVDQYAAAEPEVLRRDFYNSLLAAHTVSEVHDQLGALGLDELRVETTSDRHFIVFGTLK